VTVSRIPAGLLDAFTTRRTDASSTSAAEQRNRYRLPCGHRLALVDTGGAPQVESRAVRPVDGGRSRPRSDDGDAGGVHRGRNLRPRFGSRHQAGPATERLLAP